MTVEEILRCALELPVKDRASLAAQLLESLDAEVSQDEAEKLWAVEIERREAEALAGSRNTTTGAKCLTPQERASASETRQT